MKTSSAAKILDRKFVDTPEKRDRINAAKITIRTEIFEHFFDENGELVSMKLGEFVGGKFIEADD